MTKEAYLSSLVPRMYKSEFDDTLKKQSVVLREWSDTIWTVMVEKAIVHRTGSSTPIPLTASTARRKISSPAKTIPKKN